MMAPLAAAVGGVGPNSVSLLGPSQPPGCQRSWAYHKLHNIPYFVKAQRYLVLCTTSLTADLRIFIVTR
ncbi:hypothetical protein Y1Q_0023383 [Alligator mississippiensis]|uniref:Uncharacterized protein n=1 Tax=Alligator mississippiensis TaxID=8496 RepID=A0A151NPA3_ALLMI|nr:hypothetical protein Y1Q_0023383 [Alligator mississippiensis]